MRRVMWDVIYLTSTGCRKIILHTFFSDKFVYLQFEESRKYVPKQLFGFKE